MLNQPELITISKKLDEKRAKTRKTRHFPKCLLGTHADTPSSNKATHESISYKLTFPRA